VSLDVRAGDVPLMVINVTFVEPSKCDQLSAQVGMIGVLKMDERTGCVIGLSIDR
jgi:hypothetical protein